MAGHPHLRESTAQGGHLCFSPTSDRNLAFTPCQVHMKKQALIGFTAALLSLAVRANAESISSLDGKLTVDFRLNEEGAARYSIR